MMPETLYLQLGQLLAQMPDLRARPITKETHQWLARAVALVESVGDLVDANKLRVWADLSLTHYRDPTSKGDLVEHITAVLYRALARAELKAPAAVQGTFINAGNPLDAFAAVGRAVEGAKVDVLFVDPYADDKLLTHFAVQVPEGVNVRILSDERYHKPTLKPAAQRWTQQYARPLEVRLATTPPLHDRLILIDDTTVWVLGQSFKNLAVKAPSSIVLVDAETAALKISAYREFWEAATAL